MLNCVDATENEAESENSNPSVLDDNVSFLKEFGSEHGWGVAPWHYEQLAIMYRKEKQYQKEVEILERYEKQEKAPGVGQQKLADRLVKSRELAGKYKKMLLRASTRNQKMDFSTIQALRSENLISEVRGKLIPVRPRSWCQLLPENVSADVTYPGVQVDIGELQAMIEAESQRPQKLSQQ